MLDTNSAAYALSKAIISYVQKTSGDDYSNIAKKLKVSRAFISVIAKGRRNMGLENMLKIAVIYKTSFPDLISASVDNASQLDKKKLKMYFNN
ncbi:MAG: helix-turn-helix transcriptional regulator [Candidatus Pacearchaeota archaeon]|jgi:transcriptional regulator with XRE-family HTH domain